MCYSAESSIISFLLGGGASLYLLNSKNNTNKHIGLFLFSVCLIQFLEFLIWIDQSCGILNNLASRSILLVLITQLYVIFLGGYIYKTLIIPDNILKILIIILTIFYLYYGSKHYLDQSKEWCTKPNEDKSLQWANFNYMSSYLGYIYYTIFIISPFLVKEIWKGLLILFLGFFSFIITRYRNTGTSNSRWCYFSAFLPIIFAILDYFKV